MAAGDPTNAEIADRLALFAALLELSEASPFSIRAYLRAAEIVRSTPASVAELVRAGRIRELRGIGAGIEKKLRELVETGEIAELRALEQDVEPELVGFGRLLGLTPSRTLGIARELGVRSAAELKAAVEEGRLGSVRGIGPTTEAKIRAALERPPAAPRGLTLDRSLALSRALADALEGEVAGAPRRYCELSYELAVVCAAEEPAPEEPAAEAEPAVDEAPADEPSDDAPADEKS